ncbi:SprT family protein [Peribacillus sp. SCS-26]|uniref:SprT family protein n=1 Tax=Paraperibacillus marinus TaxID=3115295 RepID=UPI003905D3BF
MNDQDLQRMVESVSLSVFGKPFKHKALFNPRLRTTGGRYLLKSHNIEINRKYYEQYGESELTGIIKHELCHYHLHLEGRGYKHRDQDFRKLLSETGSPRFCQSLPQQKKEKRRKQLRYMCSGCGQIYIRKRRVDTTRFVCGKCKGKLIYMGDLTQ